MKQHFYPVSFVLSTTLLGRIATLANRLHMSDSDVIRLAVEAYPDPPAVSDLPEPVLAPRQPAQLSAAMAAAIFTKHPHDERN